MCGLFFISSEKKLSDCQRLLAKKALDLLRHRGPDGNGLFESADKRVVFGHTRLAILGLGAQGDQPFIRDKKVLIYNGEIYNIKQIMKTRMYSANELNTNTDTEIFFRVMDDFDTFGIDDVDGMYAYAFLKDDIITVGTDHFGEKPMFIYEGNGFIAGCSELRVLASLFDLEKRDRVDTELEFLALGNCLHGATFYKNVRQLKPGEHTRITNGRYADKSRNTGKHGYQQWHVVRKSTNTIDDHLRKVTTLLIDSLEKRLNADVPVCLLLSGGVDSTLIAALAAKELNKSLDCITVSFGQKKSVYDDEAATAKRVATEFGHMHQIVQEGSRGDMDVVGALLESFGQPQDNPTSIALSNMTSVIKKKYKVALTGMGADEIFCGYGKHQYFLQRDETQNLLFKNLQRLYGHYLMENIPYGSRIERKFLLPNFENYIAVKNPEFYKILIKAEKFKEFALNFEEFSDCSFDAYRNFEITQLLPFSKNITVDVASMRSSVEIRSPYLNTGLAAYVKTIPANMLCGREQKGFLRSLLRQYLPSSLWDLQHRPKTGFSHPARNKNQTRLGNNKNSVVWKRRHKMLEEFYN